ncbi:MAG TPA: hypothetical protein VF719_07510, partial [Abditibacteriaceae bacterium]
TAGATIGTLNKDALRRESINNSSALAGPNGAGSIVSSATLSGGVAGAGKVQPNSGVLSSGKPNVLTPSPRVAQENLIEGASKQPVKEPIGAGNSNLPAEPVRLAPTIDFEKVLPLLSNELGFIDLRNGDTLPIDQVNVRVKGVAGAKFGLKLNGVEVSEKRVGTRSVLDAKQLEGREYVGVSLLAGRNVLELTQSDGFGNVRGKVAITVIAPGKLGRLTLEVPKQAYADGRTPTAVTVRLTDDKGVFVTSRTPLTLEASLGTWRVIDLNPLEPGVQVFIEGGHAEFALVPPLETGDALIRVTSGVLGATTKLSFLPDLRPLLGVGLLETQINLFRVKSVGAANDRTLFDEQLRNLAGEGSTTAEGRGAAYFKGRVKGSYLLTLRYDTQRDSEDERLFRDIQPDEFYPVYGDSSIKGFDAQSTSRLYVRVDKNKNYVLYGDYTTPSQNLARSLGEYNRSLTGLKAHHETEKLSVNAFASRDSARRVVVELPANGTSGPYLLNGLMVRQSEKIEIIVRDRNQPSVVLRVTPQTRF